MSNFKSLNSDSCKYKKYTTFTVGRHLSERKICVLTKTSSTGYLFLLTLNFSDFHKS